MRLHTIHSTKATVTLIATVLLLCTGQAVQAQPAKEKDDRLLIILNGSASMQQPWKADTNRYQAATGIIWLLATRLHEANQQVGIGLRLYGHQYNTDQHTCADTRMEVPPGKDNQARLYLRLGDISPKGEGSLAYALQKSYEQDLADTGRYRYSLLVVTDTSKGCAGDPCAVLNNIRKTYQPFKLYIIVLANQSAAGKQSCYDRDYTVTNNEQAARAIQEIVKDFPKGKEREYFELVTKRRQPTEEQWQTKQKDATPEKKPEITATQTKKPPAKEVVIRKQSHINTDALEYGYINLLYTQLPPITGLYRLEEGSTQKVYLPGFPGKPNQRIKIPIGNYQLIYKGTAQDTVNFFIKKNMITDVQLR